MGGAHIRGSEQTSDKDTETVTSTGGNSSEPAPPQMRNQATEKVADETPPPPAARTSDTRVEAHGAPVDQDQGKSQADVEEPVSRVRRALRLVRASLLVLQYKGPRALLVHVRQWLEGKRGYYLEDIQQQQALGMDFHEWFLAQRATPADIDAQGEPSARFALCPLISFLVPVYNPAPWVLHEMIESVLAQTYDAWELCLVDGASTRAGVRETLQRYIERDTRIRLTQLDENKGIAGNSNEALAMARGEFVTLLDHDDLVEPDLLFRVVEAINTHPDADVVYYDEDLLSSNGKRHRQLTLKPEWSPDLIMSTPLLTHSTLRRHLVLDAGGFDPAYDGTQDWELFLRLSERTERIVRVPRVLYHWRMVEGSAAASSKAKAYVYERQLAAIQSHMRRLGAEDAVAYWVDQNVPRVVWTPKPTIVSIIIPTKDHVAVLRRCLDSILTRTAYGAYEIILVDTGSIEEETHEYYATLRQNSQIKLVQYQGQFNYSRACNLGAQHATGESLLFLNNDVEVLDADWLEELVRWSNLPPIGIVGAKLLYPHRRIQHAGVFLGASGLAGHLYLGAGEHAMSILGSTDWYRDCSAVTGALHMMRREVYDAVGGYDERYDISYSDVAICIEAIRRGYRVLYDPFVCLLHYESQSRSDRTPSRHDMLRAGEDFGSYIEDGDPYFSPHLSYCASWPKLRRSDEPSRASMYERLTGIPLHEVMHGVTMRTPQGLPSMPDGSRMSH
jgi:O-antigen biosynthesis protein